MARFLVFIIAVFFLFGCNYKEKEQQLNERKLLLDTREQELNIRENDLLAKESEFTRLRSFADSINAFQSKDSADSIRFLPTRLLGNWNAAMECIATACSGYVIGDKKTEQWSINYHDSVLVAKAMQGKQIIRFYSGTYKDSILTLVYPSNFVGDTLRSSNVKMNLTLKETNQGNLTGTRTLVQENGCSVSFKVDLSRK